MFYLYCDRPTDGGIALIRALKGKRIKAEGSRFRPKRNRIVINWGSTHVTPHWKVVNSPDAIEKCANKHMFFISMNHLNKFLPPFTSDIRTAKEWIKNGKMAVGRAVLNGHSGQGIRLNDGKNFLDNLEGCPLYTQYIPKDEEYRVHCLKEPAGPYAFYVQKKVKRKDFAGKVKQTVRNHENGYTYQHNNVALPIPVSQAVCEIFAASGLDFGAVDVIYCKATNKAYVLEINTAPGLEGHSVEVYAAAFQKYFA